MRGYLNHLGAGLAFLGALLFSAPVFAQGTVQQTGSVTNFHSTYWFGNGAIGDGGLPTNPYISALGIFSGANCPFGVSSQSGPGVSTSPYSLFTVCQTAAQTTFYFQGFNGQANPSLHFNVGGVDYPFPFGGGTGSVTSVATDITLTGGPITTVGTLGRAALTGDVTATAGSNTTTLAHIPAISGAALTALPAASTLSNGVTGSGLVVLATSPTLVSPALGTPASGIATNLTGTAAGLTAGAVTTNANLTGPITSTGNATAIASQTGTGTKFVVDTGPTIVTPTVTGSFTATGLVTNADLVNPATTVNGTTCTLGASCSISAAASLVVGTTTITSGANGSVEFNNSGVLGELTTSGSGSVVRATSATLTSPTFITPVLGTPNSGVATNLTGLPLTSGVTGTLPVANGGTNCSSASLTCFKNITGFATAGTTGTTSTNLVFSTSPTFVTPTLGAALATSINGVTIPVASDTAVLLAATQTLTNKSISGSQINSGTVPAAQLPLGTSAAFGAVKCDNVTITCTAGVIATTAGAGGGLVYLTTLTASSSANLTDTTHITSSYDAYQITFENVIPFQNNVGFKIQITEDGGSTWHDAYVPVNMSFIAVTNVGNGAGGGLSGSLMFNNPNSTTGYKSVAGNGNFFDTIATSNQAFFVGSYTTDTNAINGLRFLFTADVITSGKIRIYGMKTS